MEKFFLKILFIVGAIVFPSESKCLDACQYVPSFEWREQCNTCLEIPCRRCGAFFVLSRMLFLSLSLSFVLDDNTLSVRVFFLFV